MASFSSLAAKKPDSVCLDFFLAARAKKSSVIFLPASPAFTFVLVAMQKRWLTRRRGTPLTAYGPVTSRRPLSNCFKNTTRRPRKRPAKRMSTVPGEMLLRNFVGFRELFSLRPLTLRRYCDLGTLSNAVLSIMEALEFTLRVEETDLLRRLAFSTGE